MRMDIQKVLQEIGLSEKEVAIYIALLQIGEGSILDIAKNCSLKRPTIYSGVESLAAKGLIFQTLQGKRKHYKAESPEKLHDFLQQKNKELILALPQLKAITNVPRGTKPTIRYYEGEKSVISLYKSVMARIAEKQVVYGFTSVRDLLPRFPELVSTFDQLALDWKWKVFELTPKTKSAADYISDSSKPVQRNKDHKYRYLPDGLDIFDTDFVIVDDQVILLSWSVEVFAVAIESRAFAQSFTSLFLAAWQSSTDAK